MKKRNKKVLEVMNKSIERMGINKYIKRYFAKYSVATRNGDTEKMNEIYKDIQFLISSNLSDVDNDTYMLYNHIRGNHVKKKTYGCEYNRKCYNIENKMLRRTDNIWYD